MALRLLFTLAFWTTVAAGQPMAVVDHLTLGDGASEGAHQLKAERAEVVKGAMEQSARRLLSGGEQPWEGGRVSFVMKVDPERPNYLTARFWGDEVNPNYLILFCEGRQVGYRHLGDIDVLALPDDEPRYNGRFYYATTPLPRSMTAGKREVRLEIRSNGPIWGYGKNFEQYQKPMTQPSRAIYRVATHTDGCYVPAPDEMQGGMPKATTRAQPGIEVLDQVKKRVNGTLDGLMKSTRPLNQMHAQLLAKAYFVKWTTAYQNPRVIEQVIRCCDDRYAAWKKDPKPVFSDPATWNPDWFGVGPAADAVRLLVKPIGTALDAKLDGDTTRRAAWSELFRASRDYLRTHRRWYTNQTQFIDTNLYRSHRGMVAIDPANAWLEEKGRSYLYECIGLSPWRGSDKEDGGSEERWGGSYYQITDKGLSRELGYVGGYGEILGQMVDAYDATRMPGEAGDPKIKAQIVKVQRARLYFRYPMPDAQGHRAMRLETGVSWRDSHFPGAVTYAQRNNLDETAIYAAAVTLDPAAVGAAQQMMADNQFFASIDGLVRDRRLRAEFGLLSVPDDYEVIRAQAATNQRLPMTPGQPSCIFADEENGVVAIKNGDEILYVSLYWRARLGINGLARVHYLKPNYQQVAVVYEDVKFEPSGQSWKRPNWTNFGFGNGGMRYPGKLDSAHAGEELPIPRLPADVPLVANQECPYLGRGDFYQLRYGSYLIGMNTTKEKTFELAAVPGVREAINLANRQRLGVGARWRVPPRSTVVLLLGQTTESR